VCANELRILAGKLIAIGAAPIKTVVPEPERASGWSLDNAIDEGWDQTKLLDWLKANAKVFEPAKPKAELRLVPGAADLAERRKTLAKAKRDASPLFSLWQQWGLQLSEIGGPIPNLRNAVTILEMDPTYAKTIWFDEFLGRVLTG